MTGYQRSLSFDEVREEDRSSNHYPPPRYRLSLVCESGTSYGKGMQFIRPSQTAAFFLRELRDQPQERLIALFLDNKNRSIFQTLIGQGTMSRISVEPRQILVSGLLCNAASVILGHNHPSGDPAPSPEDLLFTRRVRTACDYVGLKLNDHIIIGSGSGEWVSLRQRGVLEGS